MSQLTQSTEKVNQPSHFSYVEPVSIVRSFLKLPVEWKILYALLAVMGLRLATIIAIVLKQW